MIRLLVLKAAVGMLVTGRHFYLSTSCVHGRHVYCQAQRGRVGPKHPSKCKFCPASCACLCHRGRP